MGYQYKVVSLMLIIQFCGKHPIQLMILIIFQIGPVIKAQP